VRDGVEGRQKIVGDRGGETVMLLMRVGRGAFWRADWVGVKFPNNDYNKADKGNLMNRKSLN